MRITSIINRGLLGSVLLLGFSYCNQPKEEKAENEGLKVQEKQTLVFEDKTDPTMSKVGPVFVFQTYINETKDRLTENSRNLEEIKNDFKSDKNGVRLAFEGEIFQLNKKNLELRSKINDSLNYQRNSPNEYYIAFNKEMDMLESNIAQLKKRNR